MIPPLGGDDYRGRVGLRAGRQPPPRRPAPRRARSARRRGDVGGVDQRHAAVEAACTVARARGRWAHRGSDRGTAPTRLGGRSGRDASWAHGASLPRIRARFHQPESHDVRHRRRRRLAALAIIAALGAEPVRVTPTPGQPVGGRRDPGPREHGVADLNEDIKNMERKAAHLRARGSTGMGRLVPGGRGVRRGQPRATCAAVEGGERAARWSRTWTRTSWAWLATVGDPVTWRWTPASSRSPRRPRPTESTVGLRPARPPTRSGVARS